MMVMKNWRWWWWWRWWWCVGNFEGCVFRRRLQNAQKGNALHCYIFWSQKDNNFEQDMSGMLWNKAMMWIRHNNRYSSGSKGDICLFDDDKTFYGMSASGEEFLLSINKIGQKGNRTILNFCKKQLILI